MPTRPSRGSTAERAPSGTSSSLPTTAAGRRRGSSSLPTTAAARRRGSSSLPTTAAGRRRGSDTNSDARFSGVSTDDDDLGSVSLPSNLRSALGRAAGSSPGGSSGSSGSGGSRGPWVPADAPPGDDTATSDRLVGMRYRPPELPLRPGGAALNAAAARRLPPWLHTRFGDKELKPHQVAACKMFAKDRSNGLLLYYRVGSGKTLAAIACVENLKRKEDGGAGSSRGGGRRRVVVVLPATLRDNFAKEMRSAGLDPASYAFYSFDGALQLWNRSRDAFRRAFTDCVLVVDEAHNLRDPRGKKASAMLRASLLAHKRLLLTGTPVVNYPRDVGVLLGLIDPGVVPVTVKDSRNRLAFERHFGGEATRNRDHLALMMTCKTLYYEPPLAEVAAHYPTVRYHVIGIDMSPRQVERTLRAVRRDPGALSAAFLTGLRQIGTHAPGTRSPKLDGLIDRVAAFYNATRNAKVVVFATYLEAIARIESRLRAAGAEVRVYSGKVGVAERADTVRWYNQDAETPGLRRDGAFKRVLIMSDAGTEGLDLKNTHQMHILDPRWNKESEGQAVGRAARFNSHASQREFNTVDVFRYVATMPRPLPRDIDPALREWALGSESVLARRSADEVMRGLARRKDAANQRFIDWMVAISDYNLQAIDRCM